MTSQMVPARSRSSTKGQPIQPEMPFWFLPENPVGSAVRYVATLSPRMNWVGFFVSVKGRLRLKTFLGIEPKAQIEATIREVQKKDGDVQFSERVQDEKGDLKFSFTPGARLQFTVPIHDGNQQMLGKLVIESQQAKVLGETEKNQVIRVAKELGELWQG